jgi:hypothetical protein
VLYPVELRAPSTKSTAPNVFARPMLGFVQTESEVRADYIGLCAQLKRLLGPWDKSRLLAKSLAGYANFLGFDGNPQFLQCVVPMAGYRFQ